ncbi:MAG: hypothetical protein J0M24_06630 [Verrucomicrobia bacterium]|nr:hypothetical protein [Verrucomicrobiota bacterium]
MVESNSLRALELRRRLLVAESELNRLTLRQGFADLRDQTRWVTELRPSTKTSSTPWLTLAAPVAGMLAAGALLKRGTFFGRISGLVKLATVAYPVVRAWQRQRQNPPSES